MSKKILIIILCLYFVVACGRKDDPEYKSELSNNIQKVLWDILTINFLLKEKTLRV